MINKKQKTDQQEDTTDLCPLCQEHKETQNHIFQCTQKQARNNRTKGFGTSEHIAKQEILSPQ